MKKLTKFITPAILLSSALLFTGCLLNQENAQEDQVEIKQDMPTDIKETTEEKIEEEMQTTYVDISLKDAQQLIKDNPDLVIIDVSPSYDKGHLPGAINYYLGDGSLDKAIPSLDKQDTYLVYCHVDSVAIAGAKKLIDAGIENVYRLEGNYSAWVDAGYEVEK